MNTNQHTPRNDTTYRMGAAYNHKSKLFDVHAYNSAMQRTALGTASSYLEAEKMFLAWCEQHGCNAQPINKGISGDAKS